MSKKGKYKITISTSPEALENPLTYIGRLPENWDMLGVIQRKGNRGKGALNVGALVKHKITGIYAQMNDGSTRSLDQREVGIALAATADPTLTEILTAPGVVTAQEGANRLGISVGTVHKWARDGVVNPLKDSNPRLFFIDDLLEASERPSQAGRPRGS